MTRLEELVETMYSFKVYPKDISGVANGLRKHPCLTEPGSQPSQDGMALSFNTYMVVELLSTLPYTQ